MSVSAAIPEQTSAGDPRVTKRKVIMRSSFVSGYDAEGKPVVATHAAVDFVREDFLEAYVKDAETKWQSVVVGDYDAGPGGYDGATAVPAHLDHPLAGQTFPATSEG